MNHTISVDGSLSGTMTVPDAERPARRLRAVLAVNAATSLAAGTAGLVAAPFWVERLGLGSAGWTRLISFGLVVFAIDVALLAGRGSRWLRPGALAVSAADLAWVAATIAVLATVDLTAEGRVVAVVMGVGVLDFALLQLWFRRRCV